MIPDFSGLFVAAEKLFKLLLPLALLGLYQVAEIIWWIVGNLRWE